MERRSISKLYIILAGICAMCGAAVFLFVFFGISSARPSEINSKEKAIIERTLQVTKQEMEKENAIFSKVISSGQMSLPYFLQTHFTGKEYLFLNKEDAAFLEDLNMVLGLTEKEGLSLEKVRSQSRIYTIYEASQMAGCIEDFSIPMELTTRITSVSVEESLAGEDGFSFGIRKLSGVFSADGEAFRGDLYVEGDIRESFFSFEKKSEENGFSLLWDTRKEIPGTYEVSALLRSGDGRGYVLSGEVVNIPSFFTLENDFVQQSLIPEEKEDVWFSLDAKDRNAYINLVGADGNLKAAIYDRYGNLIGANDLPGNQNEVLRGKKQENDALFHSVQDGNANLFYVRIQRSPEEEKRKIVYTLVQSKDVAVDREGRFLSVKSISNTGENRSEKELLEDTVFCQDLSGNNREYRRKELAFLPLNGQLYSLSMANDKKEELSFFPIFSTDLVEYAYVSSEGERLLDVSAIAMEGYAASLSLSVIFPNGEVEKREVEGAVCSIPISESRNEIQLTVSDFDGEETTYTVYFLSGPDHDGYDTEVLSLFPKSYRNGLWLMHNLQPAYRFEPYITGLTWAEVLEAQDYRDRSLSDGSVYPNWAKPDSPVYDGKNWRAARPEVVSYFLDPRNFLEPLHIFQFEKLSFDATTHTREGIEAMARGSFLMAEDMDYVGTLLLAGEEAGISPYFITSRILQEMGFSGESMLAHGTLPGYEGYYNFFNIGSYPNPEVQNGALINGAKYSMWGRQPEEKEITPEEEVFLLPWDSKEKAIKGGAKWIASSYIEIGQNTLYFQKFDVINNEDGLYKHQYAQNISMAYTEGARYYRAYEQENLLDCPFVFLIPVYEDMPTVFGYWPD